MHTMFNRQLIFILRKKNFTILVLHSQTLVSVGESSFICGNSSETFLNRLSNIGNHFNSII